jgi:nicotinate-nucleotide pyrophosphorylase (carboxylating)
MENSILRDFILKSLAEDLGDGDHTSLACIPSETNGKAKLLIKEKGILAGVRVAKELFSIIDKDLKLELILDDGSDVVPGISHSIFPAVSNQFLNQSVWF